MAVEDVVSPLLCDPVARVAVAGLGELSPDESAVLVARLTRADEQGEGSEAVRVAAFNSFI